MGYGFVPRRPLVEIVPNKNACGFECVFFCVFFARGELDNFQEGSLYQNEYMTLWNANHVALA